MLTIAGFLGGAMYWIGIVHNKIDSIQKNVSSLMEQTRNLSIEIESHTLSIKLIRRVERGIKKKILLRQAGRSRIARATCESGEIVTGRGIRVAGAGNTINPTNAFSTEPNTQPNEWVELFTKPDIGL